MRNSQGNTAIKVAIFFGCATFFLTAVQVGLPLKGIQLNPALGNVFLALALLSLLGLLTTLGWIFIPWIRNAWAWASRHRRYLWIVGGPVTIGLLLGGMEWLISTSLYNALGIGAAGYALAQLGFSWWAVRLMQLQTEVRSGAKPHPDSEEREQLRTARAELQRLRGEVESLTGQRDRLQNEVNLRDADREMYRGLLLDALKEGLELRESNPSKEDAQEWARYLHKLLEAAEGEWRVKPFRRPIPGYAYADLDATGEQAFMDYQLSKLQDLIRHVESHQIIKFRSGFDPFKWKDWKSPPQNTPEVQDASQ